MGVQKMSAFLSFPSTSTKIVILFDHCRFTKSIVGFHFNDIRLWAISVRK